MTMLALEEERKFNIRNKRENTYEHTRECPDSEEFLCSDRSRRQTRFVALSAEDIEWIIPGEDWPLAGTRRGHAGLEDLLHTASETVETSTEPREFVAQGDRVLVIGFATGRIKATNKMFEDDWVFAITVRNGKLTNIREYIDTQALARAAEMDATRSDA
jgi:ketosteroid isomerase-like protein